MMDITEIAAEIRAVAEKHGIYLMGRLRIATGEQWEADTFTAQGKEIVTIGRAIDRNGPFLEFAVKEKRQEAEVFDNVAVPQISSDYGVYDCPVTGKMIEGRADHRENLKRTGCRLLEKGEREHNEKIRREESDRHTEQVTDKVCKEIYQQL